MIDEGDTFLDGNEQLRGILNSGHTRSSARVLRCVGDEHVPTPFSTWAPKAYAAIGKLPSTLEDRSISVRLKRRLSGEKVERLALSELDRTFAQMIRRQLTRWAMDTKVSGEHTPEPPSVLNDRAADNWRPLFAVAADAGADWVAKARQSALATPIDDDQDEMTMLLQDMQRLFAAHGEFVSSEHAVEELGELDQRAWGDYRLGRPINKHQLARLLKPLGIQPKQVRVGTGTRRGYLRSAFDEAFAIYLTQSAEQV